MILTQPTQQGDRRETSTLCHLITNHPHLKRPCASLGESQRLGSRQETLRDLAKVDTLDVDQGHRRPMSPLTLVTGKRGLLLKEQHHLPLESGLFIGCCMRVKETFFHERFCQVISELSKSVEPSEKTTKVISTPESQVTTLSHFSVDGRCHWIWTNPKLYSQQCKRY